MMWGWGGGGWSALGMGVGSLLFLGLIVAGIVLVVRGSSEGTGSAAGRTAGQILDERFARGEIDKEEYEERSRVLRSAGGR